MKYQIIDINLPEDDPEVAQVVFAYDDEDVDPNVYVLEITYRVYYESHPGNPNCWSSDWDYMGYTECDAEVISLEVTTHDPSRDTDCLVGTGEQVDGISIGEVMTREVWASIRRNVESNYCKYMETLTEDDYDA